MNATVNAFLIIPTTYCHLPRRPQEVEEKTLAPTQKWPIRSLFLHHSARATNSE